MNQESLSQRLSLIPTLWSLVRQAHQGSRDAVNSARAQLLERYGGAIRRYLRKVLPDRHGADDVFQEFSLQLLRGNLRGADPERGRFRNFVKGTLFHLIGHHRKQQRRWPAHLPEDASELLAQPEADSERQFTESWRDEFLARAWTTLAESEAETGQPFHTLLRFRADHPEIRAPHVAEQLALQLGRPFTAAGIRQILHRAREKFADFLLDEVTHALENPTLDELVQELADLGLLDYCRPILERYTLSV